VHSILLHPPSIAAFVSDLCDAMAQVRSEFVFNNPNSKGECGCGESFNV
jgi:iron-sulfur cluster assembly protein